MKYLAVLLLSLLPLLALAQVEDDYYAPEEKRAVVTKEQVRDMSRWGPKLGIELHVAVAYNHLMVPGSIAGAFSKSMGGVGMDAGGGIRVRLYHKLAMAGGFNFAIRNYSLSYEATNGDTINPHTLAVEEDVTMYFMGFYHKTIFEVSRKIHLALAFQYTWINQYKGHAAVEDLTDPTIIYAPMDLDRPLLDGWTSTTEQAELGIEFAYKLHIAPELIIKPYLGLGMVFSPAVHTGYSVVGLFGESEQNPNFVNLRLGVIIETGLWLDKLKTKTAKR